MTSARIGLVDLTGALNSHMIDAAAAAISAQIAQDVVKFWPVEATIEQFPSLDAVPAGVWPVQLVDSLPDNEGGYHNTLTNQPFAKVIATQDSNDWTLDASHEIIEMLIDPYGNRLQASTALGIVGGAIQDVGGTVQYVVEACDPCQTNSYPIDGFKMSDFVTPHFYDPQPAPGTQYSLMGVIDRPRQILPGGYISWVDPDSHQIRQILWLDPGQPPQEVDHGQPTGASLRAFIEVRTAHKVRSIRSS